MNLPMIKHAADLPTDEEQLLGSMLLQRSREPVDVCRRLNLTPEAFVDPVCRRLYEALSDLSKERPFDPISLHRYLVDNGILLRGDREATFQYVEKLQEVASLSELEYFVLRVLARYRQRKFEKALRAKLAEIASDSMVLNLEPQIRGLEQELSKILPENGAPEDMTDLVSLAKGELAELIEKGEPSGLMTGFGELDGVLAGLKDGDMIVIGARPSVGKTALGMNIAFNVAQQGKGVLVFSCEMKATALVTRMLVGEAGINVSSASAGLMHQAAREKALKDLDAAGRCLAKLPIAIVSRNIGDVEDVCLRAKAYRRNHPLSLIVIDYLQMLSAKSASMQGRQNEVGAISRKVKELARDLGVPVIAISQLSRACVQRQNEPGVKSAETKKPQLSDLRDSGTIEQDADVIILLSTVKAGTEDTPRIVRVDVAKNRNGPTRELVMAFHGRATRFEEVELDAAGAPIPPPVPAARIDQSRMHGNGGSPSWHGSFRGKKPEEAPQLPAREEVKGP